MDCLSGPGEEGRQDKRFGFNTRRTHGKARRTFRRKSCKIRSTTGAAAATICVNVSGKADSAHQWYPRCLVLDSVHQVLLMIFIFYFLSRHRRMTSRRLFGLSLFHSSSPLGFSLRCGRLSCSIVKEADTEAYSVAGTRELSSTY